MKKLINLTFILLFTLSLFANTYEKPRIIVLTDIENEPDDAQSMVRFLAYSNQFEIEGLVATTSTHLRDKTASWRIREIVKAYGMVRNNLEKHEKGFPTEEYLKSVIKAGISKYGLDGVGQGMDSEGSEWLIHVVDKNDERPVWISVWGGPNVLAQALWKVRQTRTSRELKNFVSKLRVYTISDQDNSAYWIRKEFPDLFYIVSPGGNYLNATWSGISGEPFYKFASGADTTIVQNGWLEKNIIKNHGPLGAEYPKVEYIMEGDTPSFLHLINNGLNVPERPDFGGWGGRYEYYKPRLLPYKHFDYVEPETSPIWTDATDEVLGKDGQIYIDNHATIWRWREAFQNDFASRLDWCIFEYENANHPPVVKIEGPDEIRVEVGSSILIDASKSSDPDGDDLSFRWFLYPEAGNFWHWRPLVLKNKQNPVLEFQVPEQIDIRVPQTTHLILEVSDSGTPKLTRYKRVIVNIIPK
jgi:hypothetical protein